MSGWLHEFALRGQTWFEGRTQPWQAGLIAELTRSRSSVRGAQAPVVPEPCNLERAWDAWPAERYQRGETGQRPGSPQPVPATLTTRPPCPRSGNWTP